MAHEVSTDTNDVLTLAPAAPMSSISLIQNSKREYHHEVKLYIDPAWSPTEILHRLRELRQIAVTAEQDGMAEGRYTFTDEATRPPHG